MNTKVAIIGRKGVTWVTVVAGLAGFLAVTARLNPVPGTDVVRVTGQERLARLIRVEQHRAAELSESAQELRARLDGFERSRPARGDSGTAGPTVTPGLVEARLAMGIVAVEGPGVVVTLDDSGLSESPSGNVNDLVVHSQDVQAVANGLWAAGAEAVAVNDQRVVPTSALLCVGNTLLINGTVHSPPYRFVAVGSELREPFLDDALVKRYRDDAERFELGFDIDDRDLVTVPAYRGTATVRFARAG